MMPLYFKEIFTTLPDSKIQIINLIDDVFTIWKQIQDRENAGYTNTRLRLREILAWRSLEFLRGEGLKEHINISEEGSQRATHFMVSIRHPHSTFKNLVFSNSSFRVYLSYHISETRKSPKSIKEINEFRKLLHKIGKQKNVAIFDPVAIDELSMVFALKNKREKSPTAKNEFLNLTESVRWPLELTDLNTPKQKFPIKLVSSEIDEVGKDIANQIQSRDYTLVDTATCLAVYRPYYDKKLSRGVEAEIKRANETFSTVVVFHPNEDRGEGGNDSTHPFGSKVTIHDDKKKFVQHLQKLIKENKKKTKK